MVYTLQSYNAFWGLGWVKVLKPSLTHYDKILGLFKEKMMKISRYGNQETAHSKYIGKLVLECFNNFSF
jgi:hypothetical protein